MIEYSREFKSQYPDSDIDMAQPMIMARGYGDDPGLDYVQLVDADVFEDDEIELADWRGPYALWKNDRPQSRAFGLVPCPLFGPEIADACNSHVLDTTRCRKCPHASVHTSRMNRKGRLRLRRMDDPIVYSYADQQAIEDGFLAEWSGQGNVNRITTAVYDYYTQSWGSSPITGQVSDLSRLTRAIDHMLGCDADADGWRTGTYEEKELWLVPNECEGLTLMFPSDY